MKRILVIDDSSAIRKAVRRILESMDFVVEDAADGAVALERCERLPAFDAILCDIDMPVMDGLAFLQHYVGRGAPATAPVIMCTTHNSFDKIQEALGLGASEYIMKPFDADIVGSKLLACGVR